MSKREVNYEHTRGVGVVCGNLERLRESESPSQEENEENRVTGSSYGRIVNGMDLFVGQYGVNKKKISKRRKRRRRRMPQDPSQMFEKISSHLDNCVSSLEIIGEKILGGEIIEGGENRNRDVDMIPKFVEPKKKIASSASKTRKKNRKSFKSKNGRRKRARSLKMRSISSAVERLSHANRDNFSNELLLEEAPRGRYMRIRYVDSPSPRIHRSPRKELQVSKKKTKRKKKKKTIRGK